MRVGYTMWARQTIDSDIFTNKPDKWFKMWFYVVSRVNYTDTQTYERGECFLLIQEICEATKSSSDQVKKFLKWCRENDMLLTQRSTRGIYIKVLKYHIYQDNNYYRGTRGSAAPGFDGSPTAPGTRESGVIDDKIRLDSTLENSSGTREAPEKHQRSTPIVEEGKKERILGEINSPDLKDKEIDMGWNNKSDDYEEGIIDLDGDGSLKAEKKPTTKKYPNALAIRKIFQEVLGRNDANWKINKTQLQACENLYTERGVEKVRNALEWWKEHKDVEFCPRVDSPYDLDAKYVKLSQFKTKYEN